MALLPLVRERQRFRSLTNDETPLFRPLASDAKALERMVRAVEERADELRLEVLPRDGAAARVLGRARATRWMLFDSPRTSPIVETDGDYDSYLEYARHRWHSQPENRLRKIVREGGEVELLRCPDELDGVLAAGLRLEASGWKGAAGTAILARPDTAAFYRAIAREFHARGLLRLSWITYADTMIAFEFSILHARRLWMLKVAYDERSSRLAPGLALRLAIIQRCFEDDIDAYELLGHAEDWKLMFATDGRELADARSYARGPIGLVAYGYRGMLRPPMRTVYRAARRTLRGSR